MFSLHAMDDLGIKSQVGFLNINNGNLLGLGVRCLIALRHYSPARDRGEGQGLRYSLRIERRIYISAIISLNPPSIETDAYRRETCVAGLMHNWLSNLFDGVKVFLLVLWMNLI